MIITRKTRLSLSDVIQLQLYTLTIFVDYEGNGVIHISNGDTNYRMHFLTDAPVTLLRLCDVLLYNVERDSSMFKSLAAAHKEFMERL